MAAKRARRSEADRPIKSRRKKSKIKLMLVVLVVIVGAGGYYLHSKGQLDDVADEAQKLAEQGAEQAKKAYDDIAKNDKTPPKSGGSAGGSGAEAGSANGAKPPTQRGTTDQPGAVDQAHVTKAGEIVKGAEEHFADGRFAEALSLIDGFLETSPALDSSSRDTLLSWRDRAFKHHVLSKDFVRDRRLDGETTILHRMDGSKIEVRIVSEENGQIKCVWKGINATFPASSILKRETLSADKVKTRDRERFDGFLTEAKGGGPRAFLVVIKFCVERDLRDKIPYVVEVAQRERGTFFDELFETKAAILYQRYLALTRKGRDRERKEVFQKLLKFYPDTAVAQELGKLGTATRPPDPEPEVVAKVQREIEKKLEPKKTRVTSSRAQPIVREADEIYALAMKEYRLGFPGQPNADRHTKKAWDMFKKAQALYEKAYAIEPSGSIEDKIALCQREIYSCQKQFKIR